MSDKKYASFIKDGVVFWPHTQLIAMFAHEEAMLQKQVLSFGEPEMQGRLNQVREYKQRIKKKVRQMMFDEYGSADIGVMKGRFYDINSSEILTGGWIVGDHVENIIRELPEITHIQSNGVIYEFFIVNYKGVEKATNIKLGDPIGMPLIPKEQDETD